jgi:hypothetical protein
MVQLRHVLRHRVRPHPQQVLLHGHAAREAAVGGVEEVLGDVASAGVERLPAPQWAERHRSSSLWNLVKFAAVFATFWRVGDMLPCFDCVKAMQCKI